MRKFALLVMVLFLGSVGYYAYNNYFVTNHKANGVAQMTMEQADEIAQRAEELADVVHEVDQKADRKFSDLETWEMNKEYLIMLSGRVYQDCGFSPASGMSGPGLVVEFREFKTEENGTISGYAGTCSWIQITDYQGRRMAIPAENQFAEIRSMLGVSDNENVYAYIPTTDGRKIPIPYSKPDVTQVLAEKEAHLTIEVPELSGNVKVGSTAVVPSWEWVEVINEEPVTQFFSNGTGTLSDEDTCGIEMGGVITVVKMTGQNLTVEYTAPGNPAGTPCPTGVNFIIGKNKFREMSAQYTANKNQVAKEMALVQKLLAEEHYGDTEDAGEWDWVKVVNPDPVRQEFSNGYDYLTHGDTCGAGSSDHGDGYVVEGGTIQARGKAPNGYTLYEYTAKGSPMGTPCPSGILFFASK